MSYDYMYISDCCGACCKKERRKNDIKTIERVGEILYKGTCSKCNKTAYFYDKKVDYLSYGNYKYFKENKK